MATFASTRLGIPACLGLLLFSGMPAMASPTVSGRVFLDANHNGAFDPGENGVAGCVISDERAFARSDADGRYQLALSGNPAVVFVVNAPGTWSLARWWVCLAGGSDSNEPVDFPLMAQDQSGPLYFVQGTDPHLQHSAVPDYRRYIAQVNALPVPLKFVVHTGDLVIDSSMATLERARELFSLYEGESKGLKPPLRNVMGNHDNASVLNSQVKGDDPGFGKALYRERLGPVTYAFRYGPYHFIALDGTLIQEHTIAYGLTQESAVWAIRYLQEIPADEPIVLLIHEPMFPEVAGVRQPDTPETRPHEARLGAALQGHKLVMTLAGHVHNRGETKWAGAPHRIGGAISYNWHGILPYPPAPCAYVLYRLEQGREEHVFLDWNEERSIDIAAPSFTSLVRGPQRVCGVVADLSSEVSAVECVLGGQKAAAVITRRGHLATAFETSLDTSNLAEGVYDLLVTARAAGKQWTERQPVVVANGKLADFAPAGEAKLTFCVDGKLAAEPQVSCNGHPLALAESTAKEIRCSIPAGHLRRLNEIVIRGAPAPGSGKKAAVIKTVTLEYKGKAYRDVRYAPLARRTLGSPVVSYIDLSYLP